MSLTIPDEGIINYSYDPLFPEAVSRMSYPGGSSRTTTYDDIGRLSRIHVASVTGSTLMDYRYSYSGGDYHITRKETEHGLYEYEYDQGGRVKRAVSPDFGVEGFTYDEAGRRQGWSYNVNGAVTKADGAEYRYDPQGSRVEAQEGSTWTKYFYNQDERLARIEAVGGEGSYGYNPDGTRRWKSTGGKKTYFYYTEQGMVGEFDEAGSLGKEYGWSPYGMWGTDPLFAAEGGEFGYYGTDHLGTPQMMVNQRNKSIWSARYKVFGEASVTGSFESNLRFPGQYYDHESGLHQNWWREYGFASYAQEDPLFTLKVLALKHASLITEISLSSGGLPILLEGLYAYAGQDPLTLVDPTGLVPPHTPRMSSPPGVNIRRNIEVSYNESRLNPLAAWYFYQRVKNKGEWDYKQYNRVMCLANGEYLTLGDFEAFGNFNFGATGKATGFTTTDLRRGAGWAQRKSGTTSQEWGNWWEMTGNYGDDPRDQLYIKYGISYYRCLKQSICTGD